MLQQWEWWEGVALSVSHFVGEYLYQTVASRKSFNLWVSCLRGQADRQEAIEREDGRSEMEKAATFLCLC